MNPVMLMAPPSGEAGGGGGGSMFLTLLPFALIFFIFYFLVIRPQQKRQKALAAMIDALKQGDRVLTTGGVFGTVVGMKDNIAVLKIADQVKIEVAKNAITTVVEKGRDA